MSRVVRARPRILLEDCFGKPVTCEFQGGTELEMLHREGDGRGNELAEGLVVDACRFAKFVVSFDGPVIEPVVADLVQDRIDVSRVRDGSLVVGEFAGLPVHGGDTRCAVGKPQGGGVQLRD